mgnify:CR=1 FL=1
MVNLIEDTYRQLMSVNVIPQGSGNSRILYTFNVGTVREKIKRIFQFDANSFFMRTFANPEAIDSLDKWDKQLGRDPDSRGVRFDAGLMDVYLNTLKTLVEQYELDYASYDLIQNKNVHNLERHFEQPQWPVVHVLIENESHEQFVDLVKNLNSPEAYAIIQKKEAPQNYRMPQVNHLREREINPLTLDKKFWKVNGTDLKSAIDNLCVFSYICDRSEVPRVNEDGYP